MRATVDGGILQRPRKLKHARSVLFSGGRAVAMCATWRGADAYRLYPNHIERRASAFASFYSSQIKGSFLGSRTEKAE